MLTKNFSGSISSAKGHVFLPFGALIGFFLSGRSNSFVSMRFLSCSFFANYYPSRSPQSESFYLSLLLEGSEIEARRQIAFESDALWFILAGNSFQSCRPPTFSFLSSPSFGPFSFQFVGADIDTPRAPTIRQAEKSPCFLQYYL